LVVSISKSKKVVYKVCCKGHFLLGECCLNRSGDASNFAKQYASEGVHKTAERNESLKISEDSHNSILNEIIRRERLEYDPSRVFVGDEDNEE
jgi:hypothetical protein